MDMSHVPELRERGYAIIRGFLDPDEVAEVRREVDKVYAEGMKHHKSYRDHNLLFEVLDDPAAKQRLVLQAYWFAWINEKLEALRRNEKYFRALAPLLGPDIKQMVNQIHWKHPGAKYTYYRYHQDIRFRERKDLLTNFDRFYVTTGLAVNRQGAHNGALKIFPYSHKKGYLGLSDQYSHVMIGNPAQDDELRAKGLAREVINRIQNLRKQADFAVTDRIRVLAEQRGVQLGSGDAKEGEGSVWKRYGEVIAASDGLEEIKE